MVGAGPGDPDLLTLKAYRLLSQCDTLVYDALVPKEILELVKDQCKLFFVGKKRGHHSTPQTKTNALLLELAGKYKSVVRLKGGDPFVFGRGGEEAAYLQQHGISVQVVPGITSGVAAAAYLGIPLTHRLAGSSVTFVTGHEGIDKQRPFVNWKRLAQASPTLVIYMGVHNLRYIVQELLDSGLPPQTPSAVIQYATVIGQRSLTTSLDRLVEEAERNEFSTPSIVIVGEIIKFQIKECVLPPSNASMPKEF
ncbi:Uroporphyrinogen-III methyltransferase [Prochlorococcus sp. MIT 0602]|nr:Uroporphyrinogen-III methyltransferase [Prochlorococcus sp. MIT 0602]